jgi:hypothetical protein
MINKDYTNQNQKDLKSYNDFCLKTTDNYAPYILIKKEPGELKKVYTHNRGRVSLKQRQDHLEGIRMTGGRAKWYPVFMIFDIDKSNMKISGEQTVDYIREQLHLKDYQFEVSGSLSYQDKGHFHIYVRPEWKNQPTYLKKNQSHLLPIAKKIGAELYPQSWRKVCDPFSPFQPRLDKETLAPLKHDWKKLIEIYSGIEPVDLSSINGQEEFEFNYNTQPAYFPEQEEIDNLINNGLQEYGTRHNSILKLACFYSVSENVLPQQAKRLIWKWIFDKHNYMSKDIATGKMTWQQIRNEIDKAVDWSYKKYMRTNNKPNPVHNLGYGIAQSHLDLIADIFPGQISNQKKLFKLISFYAPRSHWKYVFIHWSVWHWIAGDRYKDFQRLLLDKRIMELPVRNPDLYIIGRQSKRFKLHIPVDNNFIAYNKRNISNYNNVMAIQDPGYLKNKLKLSRKNVFDIKHSVTKTVGIIDVPL